MGEIGSLFSGAGGLDLAVQAVFGGAVVWHAEIDKAASRVLAHRFPGVPNLGSVTDIDWAAVPAVDVLCGGFPCTDVSAAGKRAGMHGTRSGLWSHMAEAIDVLRPRHVVIENVRGLLSANANRPMESATDDLGDGTGRPLLRAIGAVLGDLADIGGYEARWVTVAAADVGAPHRRERVFILAENTERLGLAGPERQAISSRTSAVSGGSGCGFSEVGRPCASDSSRNGRDEGRAEPARIVRGFDAALGGNENGVVADDGVALLPTPTAQAARHGADSRFGGGNGDVSNLWQIAHLLPTPRSSDCFGAGQHGDGGMDLRTTISLLPTPKAHDGEFGTPRTSGRPIEKSTHLGTIASLQQTTHWGKYEPAIRRWEALVGPAPAPTEPNKNGNPRLSATFSEWLMGWPAGWVTDPAIGISRNDQLRIIGNGVCPQQAIAALQLLLPVSEVTP